MITQTIDLCMIPGSTNPVIHVNQYDAYPGGLIFNLYEESAFEIPTGAAVTINGTKPDKYGFSYTASYSGNVVTADLEQQMTAVAGNVECELRVSLGSEIIGTQNFTLCVEEAALNNETIISDTDIPALVNAQRYASEAAASAGEAETSADAAAGSAESAAASAEAAAQDFSNAVKYTDIVNNGTYSGTAGEKVLDAAMGKTLTDSIDTKVAKAGDTMTGSLNIMATDITIGDVPASSTTFSVNRLNFVDSNGVRIGYITPFYRNTDVVGFDISVTRVINGANAFNSYKIELAAGGGNTIKLTDPGAWRDALGVLPYNNNVSTSGVSCIGYLTSSRKQIAFMVPYPLFSGTGFTISSLKLVVRHIVGTTYAYVRSGTNGATYTQLGSGATSVIANGEAVRSNEIASTKVWVHPGSGIEIGITFKYEVCSDNSGTVLPNNTPLTVAATLTGTIS